MKSLDSCKLIYPPKGQAGEYAKYAVNHYRGCGHGCVYCYVPLVTKQNRAEFDAGARERKTFDLDQLEREAQVFAAHHVKDPILLSFSTDPYAPNDVELQLTRKVLTILKRNGLAITTLTKGGARALRDLDLFDPATDWFASTLTSLDPAISQKWERFAALPADRIETLRTFRAAGIRTWASLEPVFDTEATIQIIRETHTFVDLYKVGRINYSELTKRIDWQQFTHDVLAVLNELAAFHYVKKDLQPFVKQPSQFCVNEFLITNPKETV